MDMQQIFNQKKEAIFLQFHYNPPIISLRLLSLSSLSKTSRAHAKKERKKERKHQFCEDKVLYFVEKTKQQRDIKQLEKKVLTLLSYFQSKQSALRKRKEKEKERKRVDAKETKKNI